MCTYVATLCKGLATDVATVGALACVSSFVGLEVAELGEALAARGFLTKEGLDARVGAGVDLEVRFLVKGFAAAGDGAEVALFGRGRVEGGTGGGCGVGEKREMGDHGSGSGC